MVNAHHNLRKIGLITTQYQNQLNIRSRHDWLVRNSEWSIHALSHEREEIQFFEKSIKREFFISTLLLLDSETRLTLKLTSYPLLHKWHLLRQPEYSFMHTHMHPQKSFCILLETTTFKQPIVQDVEDGGESPCQGPSASWRWNRVGKNQILKDVGKTRRACWGIFWTVGGYRFFCIADRRESHLNPTGPNFVYVTNPGNGARKWEE